MAELVGAVGDGARLDDAEAVDEPIIVDAGPEQPGRAQRNRFFLVAGGATLVVTAAVVVAALSRTDGHLVYALDAAIHLSMARQFAHHFTWGVTDGVYVSASSSPAWTLLLSGLTFVTPGEPQFWPLVLNIGAGAWILWLFAANQTVIRPFGKSIPSWVAAVVLPVVVLFLPAMTMVGMEHLLHAAIVLQVLVLVWRLEERPVSVRTALPLLAVVLIAGAVRIETLFVVAGVVVGLLLRLVPSFASPATSLQWRRGPVLALSIGLVAAASIPFAVYGLVNRAFGLPFLPTSIVAKQGLGNRGLIRPLDEAFGALFGDVVLTVLVAAVLAYVVFALFGGPRRTLVPAVAFLVATFLHGLWGDVAFYDRYQTYLVITGTFVALLVLGEVTLPRWRDAAVTVAVVTLVVAATPVKIPLTWDAPTASSNTYRQRYQAGRFLAEHYDGAPVATSELGYITYFHDGPVLDLLGLGSPDVARELRRSHGLDAATVEDLAVRNGVEVIAMYPYVGPVSIPSSWQLTGEWDLDERSVSAFSRQFQFFAPDSARARTLAERLNAFAPELPTGVTSLDRDALVQRFAANG